MQYKTMNIELSRNIMDGAVTLSLQCRNPKIPPGGKQEHNVEGFLELFASHSISLCSASRRAAFVKPKTGIQADIATESCIYYSDPGTVHVVCNVTQKKK